MIKIRNCLFLFISFFIYSLSTFFSKFASMQDNNLHFLFYYLISLSALFIYAILWQYILKFVPLNIAFPLKSISLIISMILAYLFFNEIISLKMILSSILIMIGIVLVVK